MQTGYQELTEQWTETGQMKKTGLEGLFVGWLLATGRMLAQRLSEGDWLLQVRRRLVCERKLVTDWLTVVDWYQADQLEKPAFSEAQMSSFIPDVSMYVSRVYAAKCYCIL